MLVIIVMLASFFVSNTLLCYQVPEPYQSVDILPLSLHGWFTNEKQLKSLLDKYNSQVIVEVGSWLGLSTSFLAKNTTGKVYAVDTWLGSEEHHTFPEYANKLPTLYQQFLSNMIHLSLCNKVIPIRMTSLEAATTLDVLPDLVYIDAAHDEESVFNDIKAWYQKLKINGIMCGDDWGHIPVQTAVKRAASLFNQNITSSAEFWCFDPKK